MKIKLLHADADEIDTIFIPLQSIRSALWPLSKIENLVAFAFMRLNADAILLTSLLSRECRSCIVGERHFKQTIVLCNTGNGLNLEKLGPHASPERHFYHLTGIIFHLEMNPLIIMKENLFTFLPPTEKSTTNDWFDKEI